MKKSKFRRFASFQLLRLRLMTPKIVWFLVGDSDLNALPRFFPNHHQLISSIRLFKTNRLAKIDWKRLIIFSIFEHHANNPVVSYHQFKISLLYMAISFRSIRPPVVFFCGANPSCASATLVLIQEIQELHLGVLRPRKWEAKMLSEKNIGW